MSGASRPAQYKQSSRKGKKAWRKNIDLTEIEQSIDSRIEHEITHGAENLADVPSQELFAVDTTGDEQLKAKLIKRKQIKKNIKSKEILDSIKSNSKVPALLHPKAHVNEKAKVQGVSKKELNRLMTLAGRNMESKLKAQVAKEGLVKAGANDLWGSEEPVKTPSGEFKQTLKEKIPEPLLKQSTTSWSQATVAPETLKHAPICVKDSEEIPHAGKSYNPDKKQWEALIEKEYKIESANEERRQQMAEYKKKIQHLMETLDDREEESDDETPQSEEEHASADDSEDGRLSLNPAVKNKKKTKYQRNKQKRHQEKVKLQQELKVLKEQLHQLEELETIEQAVAAKTTEDVSDSVPAKVKNNKKHKLGTKHSVMDDNLEVKFSDELSGSLRSLRPEGNLLYDSLRKLQGSGKIETRVPIRKGRKYKQKITEKWTYKDFK
ncbi:AaceriACR126Wp [[Ashbya] aceris (nom. inval.)]|nr:AaceriACR126Wp [[Ashbya] aceris (nom. inval.)]